MWFDILQVQGKINPNNPTETEQIRRTVKSEVANILLIKLRVLPEKKKKCWEDKPGEQRSRRTKTDAKN